MSSKCSQPASRQDLYSELTVVVDGTLVVDDDFTGATELVMAKYGGETWGFCHRFKGQEGRFFGSFRIRYFESLLDLEYR